MQEHCISVSEHVWVVGRGGGGGGGGGRGCYQPGVYVPLKALFLVCYNFDLPFNIQKMKDFLTLEVEMPHSR